MFNDIVAQREKKNLQMVAYLSVILNLLAKMLLTPEQQYKLSKLAVLAYIILGLQDVPYLKIKMK